MDTVLILPRVVNILKDRLDNPSFDLESLKTCIKKGELEVLLKLDNPFVLNIKTSNPEDWGYSDYGNYKLEGSVLASPIEPFYFDVLVPEEIKFNWKNTIYKLWSCENKHWVIKQTDLDNYLELPPKTPDWVALSSGRVAIHLVHIWEFRWVNVKKDIPNVKLLLKTVRENPDKFTNYTAGGAYLIHDPDNENGWGDSKLIQSWGGVLENYNCQD